jgi:uncharacterized protein (UPF0335 family)
MSNLEPINPYNIIKQLEEEKEKLQAEVKELKKELKSLKEKKK